MTTRARLCVPLAILASLAAAPAAHAEWRLDVAFAGSGSGSVIVSTTTGQGGTCSNPCSFTGGSSAFGTLVAEPMPGSVFAGWSGCTTASGSTCTANLVSAPDSCCPITPHTAVYGVTATFVPAPPQPAQEGYCVPTVERGWTFVQLEVGQPERDAYWASIFTTRIPVILDGHRVTPTGAPVILAALVPGVGLTCDQPYVPYPSGSPYGSRPARAL